MLNTTVMLPQAAQGALAVECRADDDAARKALVAIDDRTAHLEVLAERAYLAELGGGCTLPVRRARPRPTTRGRSCSKRCSPRLDGHVVLRTRVAGTDPAAVGAAAARDLLDVKGGRALLAAEPGPGGER